MNDTQKAFLEVLYNNGSLSISTIHQLTAIPRSTIFDNVQPLLNKEIVKRFTEVNGRGRPQTFYRLNPHKRTVVKGVIGL